MQQCQPLFPTDSIKCQRHRNKFEIMQPIYAFVLALVISQLAVNAQESNSTPAPTAECGQLKEEYLHNGEEVTKFDEFPWIGQLLFKNLKTDQTIARCGAVLISKRHLLAPAQCFVLKIPNVEPTTVVLGKWRADNNFEQRDCLPQSSNDAVCGPAPRSYEIDEIAMHPNYNQPGESHFNAIAVIRLSADVSFAPNIQPICLPPVGAAANTSDLVAQYLDYSGYEKGAAKLKKKTALQVQCMRSCRESLAGDNLNLTDYNLCTACNGRFRSLTGSALMGALVENSEPRSFFLIGLYLSRAGNCSASSPDVFLRVAPFLEWITYNMV